MEPFEGVMPRKFTEAEEIAALRQDVAAEMNAANLYLAQREACTNEEVRERLASVAREEMTHAGEFLEDLAKISPEDAQAIAEGKKEVIGNEAQEGEEMNGLDLLTQSLPDAVGMGGIVVDEERARHGPCTCYSNICFHKGVIGSLNESERRIYCQEVEHKTSPAMTQRIEHWDEAKTVCLAEIEGKPKGERLIPYVHCMGVELAKKGINI